MKFKLPLINYIFILSNIKRTPFFNGELVAEVASQVLGLSLDIRQERSFVNRYGKTIKEDI